MNVRDLKIGNLVYANLNSKTNKGMITEIYKDSVKIMNIDNRTESVIPISNCLGIELTDKILYNDLLFEKHIINQQLTGIHSNVIDESTKLLFDTNDKNIFYFLNFPSRKENDNSITITILSPTRELLTTVKVKFLHELQNVVYLTTGQILC